MDRSQFSSSQEPLAMVLALYTNSIMDSEKYRIKYKKLKRMIKNMVFENAALCDEVSQVQEKILRVKEERRFLLKKLFHLQNIDGAGQQPPKNAGYSLESVATISQTPPITISKTMSETTEGKSKKKSSNVGKKSPKDLVAETLKAKTKRKKAAAASKRLVQPIPLDSSGRPIFPIVLGRLTVHSLGEVIPDRYGFHSEEYIYPVGFCTTRIYASTKNPKLKCLYTCKISDGTTGPKFEIAADDDSDHPIVGSSASECHIILLEAVNNASGANVVNTTGRGPEFFGFSHPTIQHLIQSCPGARKCSTYKWVKFEICKAEQLNDMAYCMSDNDATLNFDALQRSLNFVQDPLPSQELPQISMQGFPSLDLSDPTSLNSLLNNCIPISQSLQRT